MKLHKPKVECEQPQLFTIEEQDGVAVLTFCQETHNLPGMNLAAMDPLWQFFTRQKRCPAKAIVLIGAPSVISPAHIDEVLAELGIPPTADSVCLDSVRAKHPKVDFMREMNGLKRFAETVRDIEAFVVSTVRGQTLLSLMGPMLACNSRVAAEDAVLINRASDWTFSSVSKRGKKSYSGMAT